MVGASREEISLEAVLDEVARRGGVEAHLQSIGVTASALRARAVQLPQP